jgi:hypothetical protein
MFRWVCNEAQSYIGCVNFTSLAKSSSIQYKPYFQIKSTNSG